MTTEKQGFDDRMEQSNIRTTLAFIRTIDAEKRTHLAELRTGIGILTIALSLMTIMIATSSNYSVSQVLEYILALAVGIAFLFLIGGYLVVLSFRRLRRDAVLRGKCDDLSCLVAEFNHHDH